MPSSLKHTQIRTLRRIVQFLFTSFCLYSGWQFYLFHQWAIGRSQTYVPRPPSVEAFLPISALIGVKKLFISGQYDPIHPAGLTIFIAAITLAFLARKGFCGWICPIGFVSNVAARVGSKIKLLIRPHKFVNIPLLSLKYLLLLFFMYLIIFKMNIASIDAFLRSPYNISVDAKMLYFFLSPSTLVTVILGILFLLSFIIPNFWCRYLCPYGALLGVIALPGPLSIKRDQQKCIDCQKCDAICPSQIQVSTKIGCVRTPECIGCLDCLSICPKEGCLTIRLWDVRQLSFWIIPVCTVGGFLLFWFVANQTGHWQTSLPPEVLKKFYSLGINGAHF